MTKQIAILFLVMAYSGLILAQAPSTQPTTSPTTEIATSQPTIKAPVMTFETKMIELGDVRRGEVKEFEFPFVNTGNAPLKIDLVSSCDCTTTEYPPIAVPPGKSAEIKVSFDSTEKEESEVIDIDIFLQNEDPETGAPMIIMLQYSYNLIKE